MPWSTGRIDTYQCPEAAVCDERRRLVNTRLGRSDIHTSARRSRSHPMRTLWNGLAPVLKQRFRLGTENPLDL